MPASKQLLCSIFKVCTLSLSVIFISIQVNSVFAEPNFGAAGDWGCTSNTGKTVSNIRSHSSPERVFALGDYSYRTDGSASDDCWLDIISAIKSRTRITIGNHEDDSNEGFSSYMSSFGLSQTYYAFTYDKVRLIVMDSDRNSFSNGSNQYNYVVSQLQQASQDSNIKWIIVYFHKPMYTSPSSCSTCPSIADTNLRDTYHPLFDQYGVDVVLMGHVHNYQRTFPIKYNPVSPSSPTRTSTATTDYFDPVGQIFVIVGTGGVSLNGLGSKSYFVKYQQDDRFGALDINIENNGNTLAGRYYTNDGVKRDVFKITKTGTAQYNFGPSLSLSGE